MLRKVTGSRSLCPAAPSLMASVPGCLLSPGQPRPHSSLRVWEKPALLPSWQTLHPRLTLTLSGDAPGARARRDENGRANSDCLPWVQPVLSHLNHMKIFRGRFSLRFLLLHTRTLRFREGEKHVQGTRVETGHCSHAEVSTGSPGGPERCTEDRSAGRRRDVAVSAATRTDLEMITLSE